MRFQVSSIAAVLFFAALVLPAFAQEAAMYDDPDPQLMSKAEAIKRAVDTHPSWLPLVQAFRQRMPILPLFWDVDQRSWYAPYVETAFRAGLLEPQSDGTLRPFDPITYREALLLSARSMGILPAAQASVDPPSVDIESLREQLGDEGVILPTITDVDAAMPHAEAVALLTGEEADAGVPPPNEALSLTEDRQDHLRYASNKAFAITMPSIGIRDLAIFHPSDPSTSEGMLAPLRDGVGHLFSFPGSTGTVMIYGHSSGYPWDISAYTKIFREINRINAGDLLYVTYAGKLHVYSVIAKETIPASDISALQRSGQGEELVLYTCWPPDDVSQRYIVRAAPVDIISLEG